MLIQVVRRSMATLFALVLAYSQCMHHDEAINGALLLLAMAGNANDDLGAMAPGPNTRKRKRDDIFATTGIERPLYPEYTSGMAKRKRSTLSGAIKVNAKCKHHVVDESPAVHIDEHPIDVQGTFSDSSEDDMVKALEGHERGSKVRAVSTLSSLHHSRSSDSAEGSSDDFHMDLRPRASRKRSTKNKSSSSAPFPVRKPKHWQSRPSIVFSADNPAGKKHPRGNGKRKK